MKQISPISSEMAFSDFVHQIEQGKSLKDIKKDKDYDKKVGVKEPSKLSIKAQMKIFKTY